MVGHTQEMDNKEEGVAELVDGGTHLSKALPPLHPLTFTRFLSRREW